MRVQTDILCTDGHGGDAASEFGRAHAVGAVKHAWSSTHDAADTLIRALEDINKQFFIKAQAEKLRSGTTATLALVSSAAITVANIGDSKAILLTRGVAHPLTHDHRPDREDERRRISAAGGRITWGGTPRVNGVLAMTRAIGSYHLLHAGVVALPDISTHRINADEDSALVLATDGLSDFVAGEDIAHLVSAASSPDAAAHDLIQRALDNGCKDNISVIIHPLPAWGKYTSNPATMTRIALA